MNCSLIEFSFENSHIFCFKIFYKTLGLKPHQTTSIHYKKKRTYRNRNVVIDKYLLIKKNNCNRYLNLLVLVKEYTISDKTTFIYCY